MPITYTVRRGADVGLKLVPHEHACGRFVASPDRFEQSYRYFDTAEEAVAAAQANGWKLRMSPAGQRRAPSLINPERCETAA